MVCKKSTIYVFQITAEAARIYLWTSHRVEVSGVSVQLMCRVQGSPRPTVTWVTPKGKEIKHPTNKYEVSLESVLTMYYSLESVLTTYCGLESVLTSIVAYSPFNHVL